MKSRLGKTSVALLAGAALLTTSFLYPTPAKADPTLAAVLGGTALAGLLLHTNGLSLGISPSYYYPAAPYYVYEAPPVIYQSYGYQPYTRYQPYVPRYVVR